MVLEATVICLDNSDWMRNGDFTPTRSEAQHDAINLICGAKTEQNPENTVGVVACAGKSPQVLVTLTSDLGKILSSLHDSKIGGQLDFQAGVQVAQLVLKHRQNKNQQQRIIFFVGSPIQTDKDELIRLGKRLKKNNVAVDIINFGEETINTEKLDAFLGAVNSNNNSHLVTIPPGPHILSDILISSPIVSGVEDMGEGTGGPTATGGGGAPPSNFSAWGGVDPNLDPELALVLKVSMEEERARQEAQAKASNDTTQPQQQQPQEQEVKMEDEDMQLEQALAMSMQQQQQQQQQQQSSTSTTTTTSSAPSTSNTSTTTTTPATTSTSSTAPSNTNTNAPAKADLDEDEEMQLALQMSMMQEQQQQAKKESQPASSTSSTAQTPEDIKRIMEDPNFVNSVLMSLPDVDPNDERIKNALANITGKESEKKEDKDKK